MANARVDTGHGATCTFGTSSYAFNWEIIDIGEQTIEVIGDTSLATSTNLTCRPGDLKEPGEISFEFQFDNAASLPALGTVETLTVTFPAASGQTTQATYVATGFVRSLKPPRLTTNELQKGSLTFKCDGKTGPTFTAGS